MLDEISLTTAYNRPLFRRAMSAWWQSTVPPVPFLQRAITWAVIWFLVGLVGLGLFAAGYSPFFLVAGLIGAGVMVSSFAYLQRTRMGRFHDEIGRHWDKAGAVDMVFSASGVVISDQVERREMSWGAIDAVRGAKGVTALRSGFSMVVVPDADLPDGISAKAFRERLREWRAM